MWHQYGDKYMSLMPPVLIMADDGNSYLCESRDHRNFHICKDHFDPSQYLLGRLNYESPVGGIDGPEEA